MSFFQEQIAAARRTALENQLGSFSSLSNTTFDSWRKLADLNFKTVKTSLEESAVICQQLLAAKDPQEAYSFLTALVQPTAEKAMAYNRHLVHIAAGAQTELASAAEEQVEQATQKTSKLVDEAVKSAPPGSENVVAIMKTALGNATANYEQLSKNTKQATEAMEANINAATVQFTQAASKAAHTAK